MRFIIVYFFVILFIVPNHSDDCLLVGNETALRAQLEDTAINGCIELSNSIFINYTITVSGVKRIKGNHYSLASHPKQIVVDDIDNSAHRMFVIRSQSQLFLEDTEIRDTKNGAFYIYGELIARKSNFTNNYAERGGGVILLDGGAANISNSLFQNNIAGNGLGSCVRISYSSSSSLFTTSGVRFEVNYPINAPVIYTSSSTSDSHYNMRFQYITHGDKFNNCIEGYVRLSRTTTCQKCPFPADCTSEFSNSTNMYNQATCPFEQQDGELCDQCSQGYYRDEENRINGNTCRKCNMFVNIWRRFLCAFGCVVLVGFISHIAFNLNTIGRKSFKAVELEVVEEVLFIKKVEATKQSMYENININMKRRSSNGFLGSCFRMLCHGSVFMIEFYYFLFSLMRYYLRAAMSALNGAVCSTLLISISYLQMTCFILMPFVTLMWNNSNIKIVAHSVLQPWLYRMGYYMELIVNLKFMNHILLIDCLNSSQSEHGLMLILKSDSIRYLCSMIPTVFIALYFGCQARVKNEKQEYYSSHHNVLCGSVLYQMVLLPMVFGVSCTVFASFHLYNEQEERLLLPGPHIPLLMAGFIPNENEAAKQDSRVNPEASPSFQESCYAVIHELLKGTQHSKFVPIRLIGVVCWLWMLRFVLLQFTEVMKLLSEESTYNIKDTALGAVIREVPATYIRARLNGAMNEALIDHPLIHEGMGKGVGMGGSSSRYRQDLDHLAAKLVPLHELEYSLTMKAMKQPQDEEQDQDKDSDEEDEEEGDDSVDDEEHMRSVSDDNDDLSAASTPHGGAPTTVLVDEPEDMSVLTKVEERTEASSTSDAASMNHPTLSLDPLCVYDAWGNGHWRLGFVLHDREPPTKCTCFPFTTSLMCHRFSPLYYMLKLLWYVLYILSGQFIVEAVLFIAKLVYTIAVHCLSSIYKRLEKYRARMRTKVTPMQSDNAFMESKNSVTNKTPNIVDSAVDITVPDIDAIQNNKLTLKQLVHMNRKSMSTVVVQVQEKRQQEENNSARRNKILKEEPAAAAENVETDPKHVQSIYEDSEHNLLFNKYINLDYEDIQQVYKTLSDDLIEKLNWNSDLSLQSDPCANGYILLRSNRRRGGEIVLYVYGRLMNTVIWFYHLATCNFMYEEDDDGEVDSRKQKCKERYCFKTSKNRMKERQQREYKKKAEANRILVATKHPGSLFAYENNDPLQLKAKEKMEEKEYESYSFMHAFRCCFMHATILSSFESTLKMGKNDADFSDYSEEHCASDVLMKCFRECLLSISAYPIAPLCLSLDLFIRRILFMVSFVHLYKTYFELSPLLSDIEAFEQHHSSHDMWLAYHGQGINISNVCFRFTGCLFMCWIALIVHMLLTITVMPHRDMIDNYMSSVLSILEVLHWLILWRRLQLDLGSWRKYLISPYSNSVKFNVQVLDLCFDHAQNILSAMDMAVENFGPLSAVNSQKLCDVSQFTIVILMVLIIFICLVLKYNWQHQQERIDSVNEVVKLTERLRKKTKKEKLDERYRKAFGRDRVVVHDSSLFDDSDSDDDQTHTRVKQSADPSLWSMTREEILLEERIFASKHPKQNIALNHHHYKQHKNVREKQTMTVKDGNAFDKLGKQVKKKKISSRSSISPEGVSLDMHKSLKASTEASVPKTSTLSTSNTISAHYRYECPNNAFHPSGTSQEHDKFCGLCMCYLCGKRASSCNEWRDRHSHGYPGLDVFKQQHEYNKKLKAQRRGSVSGLG